MSERSWFPHGLTGRHVLIGVLAFFGVMLAANGAFVYLALSTYGGLDATDAYRKGLNYNERVAASEAQAGRGWRVEVALAKAGDRLTVAFRDRVGSPVRGLGVAATLGRPATSRADRSIALVEIEAGRYRAALDPLQSGSWILSLSATRLTSAGEVGVYRLKQRLWVPPDS